MITKITDAGESGIWLRELSRQTGIPKSTLWYWFKNYKDSMFKNVEIVKQIPRIGKSYLVLFRTKKAKK